MEDTDAWSFVDPEDCWVFDKLILAKKLGYKCGPRGTPVPKPGTYIVRPCVNAMGMSEGASFMQIKDSTDHLPVGSFWCEVFTGAHMTYDYVSGLQVLAVKGTPAKRFGRWAKWQKVFNRQFRLPRFLDELAVKCRWMNIETIGNKIIEVHLRLNPDFRHHSSNLVIPVYEDEDVLPPEGMEFIFDAAHERIGFYIKEEK